MKVITKKLIDSSRTRLVCNECRKEVDSIIQLGQEPDYESLTAFICWDCLKKAHSMLGEKK